MQSRKSQNTMNSKKFLSVDEISHLDSLCRKNLTGSSQRDALLLLVAINTGARAQEILNLKKADFHRKSIFVRGIKGSRDREIPIPDFLHREITYYFRYRPEIKNDDRVFNISYNRLFQIWRHFRPCEKKFHSLRHTFAIKVYMKTRDVKLVQICLGHASILNTMIYVDFVYSQEELRKILY